MDEKIVISSLITIDEDEDLNYEVLEFIDDGGFVIQHNQKITIHELITENANEDAVQFVFTTDVPMKNTAAMNGENLDTVQAARLIIQSLQGDLRIENVGAEGGDGGNGGNGSAGADVPFGSVNGCGGSGSDGGCGGNGGDGGDGPNVVIAVPEESGCLDVRFRCAKGGRGGTGGIGGPGGKNADGTTAESGKPGDKGKDGRSGKRGSVFVNRKRQG